jgi:ribosome biogenesis GTPase
MLNSYDNSIAYTDYVLNELIELLKLKENTESFLLFSSDHGEDLYIDGCGKSGHGNETHFNFEISSFIWYSNMFKQNNVEKTKNIDIKSTGSWYSVKAEDDSYIECRILGKFRMKEFELTNPVAVGDIVTYEIESGERKGIIKTIEPRRNYIVRQSPRMKHHLHLIAANIDQALVIVTVQDPSLKPGFIDRYLLMTEPHDVPAIIVFNKVDIYNNESILVMNYFRELYESIGYTTFGVSAMDLTGVDELKNALIGKTTLVGGQSGVGKSSLVQAMFPHLNLKTKEISSHSGKGVHTTTFAEMFELKEGGSIIDTPGIKTLSYNNLTPMDVAHNFREFFALSDECRFSAKCTHMNEPGCAVIAGLEDGTINDIRYQNYQAIVAELNEQNHWERKKKM